MKKQITDTRPLWLISCSKKNMIKAITKYTPTNQQTNQPPWVGSVNALLNIESNNTNNCWWHERWLRSTKSKKVTPTTMANDWKNQWIPCATSPGPGTLNFVSFINKFVFCVFEYFEVLFTFVSSQIHIRN